MLFEPDAQLASVLLREGADGCDVTLTQDQLAEMLGSARTSVERVLKQLETGATEVWVLSTASPTTHPPDGPCSCLDG